MRDWIDLFEDKALVRHYLQGQCMVMASTLYHLYGGTIVGIYDDVWDTVPSHVGVENADGSYADARGLQLTREQFLDGFDRRNAHIEPTTDAEIKRIWGRSCEEWTAPREHLIDLGLVRDHEVSGLTSTVE